MKRLMKHYSKIPTAAMLETVITTSHFAGYTQTAQRLIQYIIKHISALMLHTVTNKSNNAGLFTPFLGKSAETEYEL